MEAGFVDYIAKPINTRQLPELVKRYIEHQGKTFEN